MRGLIRAWEEFDLKEIESRLLVVGELTAECFSCHKIGIDSKSKKCPACGTEFKYRGFRRKLTMGYLKQVRAESPEIVFIDFEDFKHAIGGRDARKLLDL